MKKTLFKYLVVLCVASLAVFALFSCGGDEEDDIIVTHISTKEDLLLLSGGGHFVLDNDINCDGLSLKAVPEFWGSIDGQGYKIYNVNLISDNNCFGLIASIKNVTEDNRIDATIKNLALTDFTIDTDYISANDSVFVGGLVGINNAQLEINGCYVSGKINVDAKSKESYIGGAVGYCYDLSAIKNTTSDVDVYCYVEQSTIKNCKVYAGGFVGLIGSYWSSATELENLVFAGSIDVDTSLTNTLNMTIRIGGIVGEVEGYIDMVSCLSAPDFIKYDTLLDLDTKVGMLIGVKDETEILYSYWCDYSDYSLAEGERDTKCSLRPSTANSLGTPIALYKYRMLEEDFMVGDYSFDDMNGARKDSFLSFDSALWNFGGLNSDGTLKLPVPKAIKN